MAREFAAPVADDRPKPAYTVTEYEGAPVEKSICRFDEKTRTIIKEVTTLRNGYMVYFAKGHSQWYETLEALENAGLGEVVPLIRNSGEIEVNKDHEDRQPTTRRVIVKQSDVTGDK